MKKGISSNVLKIIAIITMLIDHIAAYFYKEVNSDTYFLLRSIGRIAMPIFAYLIVQGYFHTKNLKQYIFRMFILATVTQISIFVLGFVNHEYYKNYYIGIDKYLGVLYSYVLSLVLIMVIDKEKIIKKLTINQNIFLRINIFILILLAYMNLKIEFEMFVPLIVLEFYGIEKMFQTEKNQLIKETTKLKENIIYNVLIALVLLFTAWLVPYKIGCKYAMIIAAAFITLYNGKRGIKNDIIKYLFYAVFPLQHIVFYIIAMIKSVK